MLVAAHCSELFADAALPKHELLEIHRGKISLHHAKSGYCYPTIRLPHTFVSSIAFLGIIAAQLLIWYGMRSADTAV